MCRRYFRDRDCVTSPVEIRLSLFLNWRPFRPFGRDGLFLQAFFSFCTLVKTSLLPPLGLWVWFSKKRCEKSGLSCDVWRRFVNSKLVFTFAKRDYAIFIRKCRSNRFELWFTIRENFIQFYFSDSILIFHGSFIRFEWMFNEIYYPLTQIGDFVRFRSRRLRIFNLFPYAVIYHYTECIQKRVNYRCGLAFVYK